MTQGFAMDTAKNLAVGLAQQIDYISLEQPDIQHARKMPVVL